MNNVFYNTCFFSVFFLTVFFKTSVKYCFSDHEWWHEIECGTEAGPNLVSVRWVAQQESEVQRM